MECKQLKLVSTSAFEYSLANRIESHFPIDYTVNTHAIGTDYTDSYVSIVYLKTRSRTTTIQVAIQYI